MATIILSGKRDSELELSENIRQLSDDDYNRVAYWAANKYFPNGVVVPATEETPESVRPPTGIEVFTALTDQVYSDIKREAEAWYLQQAEEAARVSVTPITLVQP